MILFVITWIVNIVLFFLFVFQLFKALKKYLGSLSKGRVLPVSIGA